MVAIVKGEIDREKAEYYADLITGIRMGDFEVPSGRGREGIVLLPGTDAIKYPYSGDEELYAKKKEKLVHELDIGRGLERIGVNVPSMKAVCLDGDFPFLIMSRVGLTDYARLNRSQKIDAAKQFSEQLVLAREHGFSPGDISISENYGFDIKQNKGSFYDFSRWSRD